jgi:hypothetical protein
VRNHGDQDQTTARLIRLLDFTNQAESAELLLHEYLWKFRRGRAPLSAELAIICQRRELALPNFSMQARTIAYAPAT